MRRLRFASSVFAALVLVCLYQPLAHSADKMELPEDELALESVTPRFDTPDVVKNRNVVTNKKIEVGAYYGWNTQEPIHNQAKVGLNLGYHWSEESAVMLNYASWFSGLNKQYTDGLHAAYNLDFDRAPKPKYSLFAHYEWNLFYGKMSFGKDVVTNLSTYPIFGAGINAFENKNYPAVAAGIGQKFYFGKSVALRLDFKLQYGAYPSPFLFGKMKDTDPKPTAGDFSDKSGLSEQLELGFSFLL